MAQNEQLHGGHEKGLEALEKASAERKAELKERWESSAEGYQEHEKRASAERHKIDALFEEEQGSERKSTNMDAEQPAGHRKQITNTERRSSYKKTMYEVRTHMSPVQKTFSKFIHIPAVEKTSDAIGNTFGRPNALLAGSFAAFILVAVVYVVARTMGYRLSGTETIAAFVAGWLLGIVFDFVRVMISGRRPKF